MSNEEHRFGSAKFASATDLARAGMFKQKPNSLLVGFWGNRPLWYSGQGGLLLTAGGRGGKLATILGYNICSGIYRQTLLALDMKGELAAISQDQTPDKKFCIYWNPAALHGLPQNRINPVDYIRADSPSLVSDVKVFCENIIVMTGEKNAGYFIGRAREFVEAIALALVEKNGVLTLPDLYHAINLIPVGGDAWLDFAFEMSESQFEIARRVEAEIAASRDNDTGDGFKGILGEIFKAFACLSDPTLMESVSPPYDFSLSQLCESDQAYQFYMMPPAEFIQAWGPVIKSMFVAAMIYKSRSPSSPQQTWIIDECAQLGAFPLAVKLYTYGAGIGIRPWCVFQSTYQMRALAPDAENIVTSSAALRSYFSIRDLASAQTISAMMGDETLEFTDEFKQASARHAQQKALRALLDGGDPYKVGRSTPITQKKPSLNLKNKDACARPMKI
ncbi:MAG: TraM recognition domain-containing protein [Alphaproteobacteria bacterium]|nr:TraM recognition domain-containing protein [Alphaproteobacteria bacterium]